MEIERDTDNLTIRVSIGEITRTAAIGTIIILSAIVAFLVSYHAAMSGVMLSQKAINTGLGLAAVLSLLSIGLNFYQWFRVR